MKNKRNCLEAMGRHSRWFLIRGLWLACLMEGAALCLALLWDGGRGSWELWTCAAYLRDSGLVALLTALGGSLLLERTARELGIR